MEFRSEFGISILKYLEFELHRSRNRGLILSQKVLESESKISITTTLESEPTPT